MLSILPSRPTDLGFPDKFSEWRNGQAEAAEESICSSKRIITQCAPTGFGKSQVYMTEAVMDPGRVAIVTKDKGLEDRLMSDYSPMGLVNIRGKDNYQCVQKPGWTCKDGHVGGCVAKGTDFCGYAKAYNIARSRKMVTTNYKYWVAIHKYGTGLGEFNKVIFDEADTCPEELADSIQVSLSYREIQEILGQSFPRPSAGGEEWKKWAEVTKAVAMEMYKKKDAQIKASRDPKPTWIREVHHLKNMVQKLAQVCLMRHKEWVWEEFDWGWQFDPIKFSQYRESRLFLHIPNVSLYSATIRPKTLHMMGVGDKDVMFMDHDAVFDPKRSPVYQIDTMKVDRNAENLAALVMRLDQISTPRLNLGRNGTVHVTSFHYRNEVVRLSNNRQRIISHWDGSPVAEAVERFRAQGGLLVSPSIHTGYDFKDDECRFQIMTKVPFDPMTKVIKARSELDKLYTPYNAIRKLVQQAGRGSRSEQDWCENFILDDHARWFIQRYKFLAPKSFLDRYIPDVRGLPKPLII